MPVLFRCCRCRSVLKVARRKVGQQVECPRCQTAMIVPASAVVVARNQDLPRSVHVRQGQATSPETGGSVSGLEENDVLSWLGVSAADEPAEAPQLELDPSTASVSSVSAAQTPTFEEYEQPESSADRSGRNHAPLASPETKAPAREQPPPLTATGAAQVEKTENPKRLASPEAPATAAPSERGPRASVRERPSAPPVPPAKTAENSKARPLVVWALEAEPGREAPPYVLVSRAMLYLQAALMLLGLMLLGGGGYYLGSRRAAPVVELQAGEILLSGTVLYWDAEQRVVPDQGAVVLLLPADRHPSSPLSARAFRPGQAFRANDPDLLKLEEWGGAAAHVDAAGNYRLAVPGPGKYLVLIISRHTRRRQGQFVEKETMLRLQQWFSPAGVLIGRSKHLFQPVEVPPETEAPVFLHHFFGQDAGQ